MIFCYPEIEGNFDTDADYINTVVIENQQLFRSITEDIYNQTCGFDGKAVLSRGDAKLLDFSKYAEIITAFVPFDINRKNLISKIISAMEKESVGTYYSETMRILSLVENYLNDLTSSFDANITFSKITAGSLIKSAGVEIVDDYTGIAEKLIDYMELVREFDRDKLFVTVNFRSYVDDEETERFIETVMSHSFHVLMIENKEYNKLEKENRRIIDVDLCEF